MFMLLGKNLISYNRLEILIYLALPLLMLNLINLRCRGLNENNKQCFSRDDGTMGDNASFNSLYNSLSNIDKPPPLKKLLLYTNKDSVADELKPALKNILKLQAVIRVKKESAMTKHLTNGNYLGGVVWKEQGPNAQVTIRFPSALRTWPPNLWQTNKRRRNTNLPTSYYRDEGFLNIMNAITAYLIQPDLAKSAQVPDSKVTKHNYPFIDYDGKVDNRTIDFGRNSIDPIKWKREFILLFYLGLFYFYPFVQLVMHMTREKVRQQVDLMNMAGSNRLLHYLSWFITHSMILSFISLMTTFLLKAAFCDNGNVLNCTSFTALLFVFLVWSFCGICFAFLVYSLVNNITLAAFIVAFFCVLSYFLLAYFKKTLLALCILFHYGFLSIIKKTLDLEAHDNKGLQWSDMSSYKSLGAPSLDTKETTSDVGDILAVMLSVAIISLLIALLAELICPGKYGISICRHSLPALRSETDDTSMIVRTCNLRKWHWREPWKPRLRNFSMNMYDDQITVLLGPSYSAKSTALNLISRSYSSDTGSVKIDNMDTRTSLNRSILGLAPQHNALFRNMSVFQHAKFYSSLRGGAWGFKSSRSSMLSYLRALDLWNVRHIKARNLTWSARKRLAVANAFAMNPRILLLDEPTEGLEPCERRLVWNLLQSEKRSRTIIMTTYHMDEADALADRVGILCDGQLIFNGSAVFLKNCYGKGYQLICSQGDIYQEPRITKLISKYVPDTVVSSDKDCEFSYHIPQKSCCGIPPLLHALERQVQCVNINTLQIGTTPIIEKFMNASTITFDEHTRCPNLCNLPRPCGLLLRGCSLCLNQWKAMTLKKFFHIKHNCFLFYLLPLLLALAFAGALYYFINNKDPHIPKYTNLGKKTWVKEDKLKLDLDAYNPPCFYGLVYKVGIPHPLTELVYQMNRRRKCRVEYLTDAELAVNRKALNEKQIYALRMDMCKYETWYSRKWLHAEAVAQAQIAFLAYNKLLDKFCLNLNIPSPPKGNIEFYNHPYPALQDSKNGTAYKAECVECDFIYLSLLCLSIFTGFFTAFIIRERILGFKLMQKVQGINMATFWLAHLLWDWLFLTVFAALLVFLWSIILKKDFSDAMIAYFIVLMFFNLAQLPFLYLIMQLCRCTLFGWLVPILLLIFSAILYEVGVPYFPFALLFLIPVYTTIDLMQRICKEEEWHRLSNEGMKSSYRDIDEASNRSIMETALPYLLILAALALLYFALLLLYERGCRCRRRRCYDTCHQATQCERRNHILLLDNVRAKCVRRPVKDISFGLRCMDVLGLVGERAGKTTLNKIIISQHGLSRGRVYVRGIHIRNKRKRYRAYKYIGYCPQKNCFEPKFTGRENLKILGLIRGIKCKQVCKVICELANNLCLTQHLDKRAKWYTISDKRKLSNAIAVIGTPPLIILDQPTSGVEKSQRCQVLHILKGVNDCGSAMLLSSDNIEDFQHLCNRLALIRRGKIVAIGPVSSYRNPASRGLILMVKARPNALIHQLCCYAINREAIINLITRYLLANFGRVYLLEEIQGDMLFYLHNSFVSLCRAFQIIEHKRLELYISDFYIKHEDIELSFVTRNFRILR